MIYPYMRWLPYVYHMWIRNIKGLENIPKNKPFIVAANHTSYYETPLPYTILIPLLDKQVHALVNNWYWKNPATRIILNWGQCLPVYLDESYNQRKNAQSIKKAITFLKKGDLVVMFPEGGRSYDGKLKKAFNGVAKLALKARVPVVPMGIIDAYKVMPKGKIFPRFKRCEIRFGKPIYFNNREKSTKKTLENITRKIMKDIAKLIGQKYNY